jgi:hypothetical protein
MNRANPSTSKRRIDLISSDDAATIIRDLKDTNLRLAKEFDEFDEAVNLEKAKSRSRELAQAKKETILQEENKILKSQLQTAREENEKLEKANNVLQTKLKSSEDQFNQKALEFFLAYSQTETKNQKLQEELNRISNQYGVYKQLIAQGYTFYKPAAPTAPSTKLRSPSLRRSQEEN